MRASRHLGYLGGSGARARRVHADRLGGARPPSPSRQGARERGSSAGGAGRGAGRGLVVCSAPCRRPSLVRFGWVERRPPPGGRCARRRRRQRSRRGAVAGPATRNRTSIPGGCCATPGGPSRRVVKGASSLGKGLLGHGLSGEARVSQAWCQERDGCAAASRPFRGINEGALAKNDAHEILQNGHTPPLIIGLATAGRPRSCLQGHRAVLRTAARAQRASRARLLSGARDAGAGGIGRGGGASPPAA